MSCPRRESRKTRDQEVEMAGLSDPHQDKLGTGNEWGHHLDSETDQYYLCHRNSGQVEMENPMVSDSEHGTTSMNDKWLSLAR